MPKGMSTPEKRAEALAKHIQDSLDNKYEGLSSYVVGLDMNLESVRFEDSELKLVFSSFFGDSDEKRELILKPTGWRKT